MFRRLADDSVADEGFGMYHDLNVDIGPDSRESALRALSRLGYDVVAFTTTVTNTCKLGPEHAPKRPPGSKPVVYSVNPGDSVVRYILRSICFL